MKINKRKIPASFHKDPEEMYMELQQLKQEVTSLSKDNLKLKTQVQKVEQGREKKEKQVEELLKAHAIVETRGTKYETLFKEVSLMKRLKLKVKELEKDLQQRDEEFNRIRLDSRFTRVKELETEMKTYYSESRRLQTLVDQMQLEREQMMSNLATGTTDPVNTLELLQLREKNSKFRDLVMKMKQMQDHLKEQNDLLSEQLHQLQEGNDAVDSTQELQHFKYENEKLLNQREKLRNDYSNLLEQSKNSNHEISTLNRQLKQAEADINELRDSLRVKTAEYEEAIMKKEQSDKQYIDKILQIQKELDEERKLTSQLQQSLKEKTDQLHAQSQTQSQNTPIQSQNKTQSTNSVQPTRSSSPHLKSSKEEQDDLEISKSLDQSHANLTEDEDTEVADLPANRKFTFDDDDEDEDPFLAEAQSFVKNSRKISNNVSAFEDDDSFDREMEAEFGD